jgi:hypothetical protein
MISIGDPVRAGLVPSLAQPGGNITGNTVLGPDVGAKRLQILKEAIPTVSRVAFLWNPDNASNVLQFQEVQAAAPTLGVMVISVRMSPRIEFKTAFAAMMKERPDAFAMTAEPFHQTHIAWIMDFMAKNRLPAVYQLSENVRAGGLMSYGASQPDLFRRAAGYVHRILQGTKPADLPVELPTKFDLAVNLKTAMGARPRADPDVHRARRRGDRMMRRREFITLLGGAAAAWPLAARAQQPAKLPAIGFLGPNTPSLDSRRVGAFVQRLRELSWIEGRNVAIEYLWAEGPPWRSSD